MIQLYALSVFANILTGLLVASEAGEGTGFFGQLRKLFEENNLKFSLGVASLVIAAFKLLGPIEGDVPIIGDLLPVVAGLATGAILLFDFFRASSTIKSHGGAAGRRHPGLPQDRRHRGRRGRDPALFRADGSRFSSEAGPPRPGFRRGHLRLDRRVLCQLVDRLARG